MKTKCLAIGIILLFVGVTIAPAMAQTNEKSQSTSRGDWLYVGGSGPGNYTRIQDAIDNASDGDTVFVYDDFSPYYENVVINLSIFLLGENKNTTIIDSNEKNDVLLLTKNASNVTINEFTIRNSGESRAGIHINSNNCIITENVINNNYYGIFLDSTNFPCGHNRITSNTLSNNIFSIVIDSNSFNNEINDNYITESQYSILLWGLSITADEQTRVSNRNLQNDIHQNSISNNNEGIYIQNFNYANIFDNIITNNSVGINITGLSGVCIYNSITHNTINNNKFGIFMTADYGGVGGNILSSNNISYNENGILILEHFVFRFQNGAVSNNTFFHNNFIENNQNVDFEYSRFFSFNHWIGNFWGETTILPHLFVGTFRIRGLSFPWLNVDWHPAKEPYDILGMS